MSIIKKMSIVTRVLWDNTNLNKPIAECHAMSYTPFLRMAWPYCLAQRSKFLKF